MTEKTVASKSILSFFGKVMNIRFKKKTVASLRRVNPFEGKIAAYEIMCHPKTRGGKNHLRDLKSPPSCC